MATASGHPSSSHRPYGELVLVVGDADIPLRCSSVADKFRRILAPGKIQHVLSVGNLCNREQLQGLRAIAPRVHAVYGDLDEEDSLPDTKVVEISGFRIGLVHGHQVIPNGDLLALAAVARALDVDVLAYGNTHSNSIMELEERCFVNPGSLTGAPRGSTLAPDASVEPTPTFTLMSLVPAVRGIEGMPDAPARIDFFVYELAPNAEGGTELAIKKSAFVHVRAR